MNLDHPYRYASDPDSGFDRPSSDGVGLADPQDETVPPGDDDVDEEDEEDDLEDDDDFEDDDEGEGEGDDEDEEGTEDGDAEPE